MCINYLIHFFSSTIRNAYTAWGAGMLGLGFCLLLMCFILCMHAYCVISDENDPENGGSSTNATSTVQPMVRICVKYLLNIGRFIQVYSISSSLYRTVFLSTMYFKHARLFKLGVVYSPL